MVAIGSSDVHTEDILGEVFNAFRGGLAQRLAWLAIAGTDEDRILSRLRGLRSDLIDPAIAAHRGRIVKRTGDGSLVEFRSVVDAR